MEAAPTETVEGVPVTTPESKSGSPQDPLHSTPPVQAAPGPNTVAPSQAQANYEVGNVPTKVENSPIRAIFHRIRIRF